jgi:hypothetical protein
MLNYQIGVQFIAMAWFALGREDWPMSPFVGDE